MAPAAETILSGLTREAGLYALKELARRAGVTAPLFRSWRIEFGGEDTTVYVQPGTGKRVRFKNAPAAFRAELAEGRLRTARASWLRAPQEPLASLVPDFVVPYAHETRKVSRPLFTPVDDGCMECAFDLPLSILLSLSRWEELLPGERDMHGRFPGSQSLAFRDGFLNRPIVDEYGLAFEQALLYLLPTWRPAERKLRVKLSHDVDEIGLPFSLRSAAGHTLRRHRPLATAQDLLSWLPRRNPVYLEAVRQIAQLSLERGLDSAVYWKASPRSPWDTGYDPCHPKVQSVITWLHEHGIETGVHPGYETFCVPNALQREVERLREALGEQPLGGRQHYLRWCPETWRHWENCGLAYDSTVGYADQIGFRAGTCIPYHPWLFPVNREARLIEIPLIIMEVTLLHYMQLTHRQCLEVIRDCVARCRVVGGVFTLLWHSDALIDPRCADTYTKLLDTLVGNERFDWRIAGNSWV